MNIRIFGIFVLALIYGVGRTEIISFGVEVMRTRIEYVMYSNFRKEQYQNPRPGN